MTTCGEDPLKCRSDCHAWGPWLYMSFHRQFLGYVRQKISMRKHSKLKVGNYVVVGFSAGANLAGNWGTEMRGYKRFGLCKPKALFLIYAPVEFTMPGKKEENNFLTHINQFYPPSYVVCGRDDKVVPSRNSEELFEKLCENKVKSFFEEGNHASHGSGDGTGTDVQGWPIRAADFLS